jgi:hypothetical protein
LIVNIRVIVEDEIEEFMQGMWVMSAMGLTGTDDFSSLLKTIPCPDIESGESWEVELSMFILKHPELSHSVTI